MGKTSTESKRKYNKANYAYIYITVPKELKEQIKQQAIDRGFNSLNAYIRQLITEDSKQPK